MPPAPVRAAPPPAPGGGKKIMGMSTTQLLIVLGVALVGGGYLLYRRSKTNAANAAANTATNPSGCPQGTAPDAQGNCVQISQDYSGQLGTLQTEIADLQSAPEPTDTDTTTTPPPKTPPPPGHRPPGGAGKPGAVSGLRATGVHRTSATVRWNKLNGATSYHVRLTYQEPGSGKAGTTQHIVAGTSSSFTGLRPDSTYGMHVNAANSHGLGPDVSGTFRTPK